MEKRCLIMMPIGDQDGYAQGHFDRVYQYIVVPACRLGGFSPTRVDDMTISGNAMDMVKFLIDTEMMICDVSAKNADALYGLAVRQGIDLPVAIIKDLKTNVSLEIQQLGPLAYDESLRIDTVQKEVESLGEVLKKTYANRTEPNPLLSRLQIGSSKPEELPAPEPVEQIDMPETPKKESLPVISPLPDYVGDPITASEEIDKLKMGDVIFHMNYGKGDITVINKMGKDKIAKVQFESGLKLLVLSASGILRKIK